ncbi:MAG: PLP-dependent aminotransferase family protein [Candidatus Rokubacteria bacterium]|nr:PLP-dependent aminotransferase family protein [Candidatus Rokubacteria bacterium]MBI3825015.1 PLP-dependent aminotransferase family protein [Candidatus Rokubacteria bacterium]
MQIPIERDKPIPVARQIQAHLERLIREGLLGDGVKLPATRDLAHSLGVNRATVVLAYEELVAAGWARAHVGQGTFAAAPAGVAARAAARVEPAPIDWSALFSRSARTVRADAGRPRHDVVEPSGGISFAGGAPDSGLFPTDAFRRVLNRVVRDEGASLLQYYPVAGYPPLRRYLSTYLLRFGLEARAEDILIVNGSQQGFDLIARTLVDPGDAVAIEQPTYPRALQVFRAFGAELLPVPWDADGPRVDVFERLLERHAPKLFYCQPSAHNPTGLAMSPERRRGLLDAAARRGMPIIEDGFDPSLAYGARRPVPLKAQDRAGIVIYIGTFSKVLFPGLRIGWLVAPPPVLERLREAKQLADIHTSALIQAAVHRFCEGRLLDRHAVRAARAYGRRRGLLLGALGRWMPEGVTWTEPEAGFSLLLTLPSRLSAAALLPRAAARGVTFTPGTAFFVDGSGDRTLRLSFSALPAARIEEGVHRLADTIRASLKEPARVPREEDLAVPLV